jgi:hypothetical protein
MGFYPHVHFRLVLFSCSLYKSFTLVKLVFLFRSVVRENRRRSFTAKAWREAQLSVLSEELNMPKEQILQTLRNNGVIVIKTVDDYFANHERIPWDLPAATPTGRIEIYSTILYYYVIQNYGYDPVWDPIIAEIPPNWNGGYAVEDGVYLSPPTPYNYPTFKPTPPELFFIEYKIPQFAYTSSADNPLLMAITSNSYHKIS